MRWRLFVVATLVTVACSTADRGPAPKFVLVLVHPDPELRAEVMERGLPEILAGIGFGDELLVAVAGSRGRSFAEVIARESFPAFEPGTDNPMIVQAKRAEHEARHAELLEAAEARLRRAVDGAFADGQDGLALLDSMELAQRVVESYPGHRLSLVILSTMVEASDRLRLDEERLLAGRTQEILEALQADGLLPRLRGARVHVAGARHPDPTKAAAIRDFWMAYFDAAGAELRGAEYGPNLLRYRVD